MRRYGGPFLLLLIGAAVLRVSLFGDLYLRYVQAGLRPYLIASGAALILLALTTAALRPAHHCAHSHGPGVAWLLTLPALALLLFPPPALGSYSADREAARRAAQGVGTFPALPAGDPVTLTVAEYGSRAVYDSGRSLKGRTVRLTGFVTRDDDGTWYVTRLVVSCCAADATTAKAEIRGTPAPPTDSWVTITGTWHPKGTLGSPTAWPPALNARTLTRVPEPTNPYEKP
ncbi:TIGR03943 family putative permease subunit [Streptomyces antibioticus]|uniref:TIGR03943 family putative permease subunit n=1 Tax=Streptomyces antibioticus TaxID=1890 RepID=UPI003D70D5EA